jgi:NADPH-dependent curcumin reductase CurA
MIEPSNYEREFMSIDLPHQNQQWIYSKRPEGRVSNEHYELHSIPMPEVLSQNEVLIASRYFSVDPYMRIQQAKRDTYDVPHPLGIVQQGAVVAEVISSASDKFKIGDWVASYTGWQKLAVCHASELQKLNPDQAPVSTALGALGMPGRTAWFGLMEAGKPRPGDTLVVSGAAGAVGSLVAQFGKKAGCKVLGIAGGEDKCRYLLDTLKLDAAIDYRAYKTSEDIAAAIQQASGGVDIYFDNVGGWITDAVIPLIKLRARIIICGTIAQYDGGLDKPDLAPRFLQHMLFKRASIQGILARDYTHRMDEMRSVVAPWLKSGEIILPETIIRGFKNLPAALAALFEGKNTGKMIVTVD